MAAAPDVLNQTALGQGFAVASHALDNSGHNCNIVTQAESLVVTKELVAERYGPIRYTIGTGCSGGALAQQHLANAYPGIYQGITPGSASPTPGRRPCSARTTRCCAATSRTRRSGRRTPPGPPRRCAVYGHPNPTNPISYTEVIKSTRDPSRECSGRAGEDVYIGREPRRRPVRAAGLHDQRARRARRRTASPATRSTTPASSTASGAARRACSRPRSSSTSTPRSAAATSTTSTRSSGGRRTARRWSAPTAAVRSTPASTWTRSRSSTCADRTPARSTTSTARTHARAAAARARHRGQPGDLARQVPLVGDGTFGDESILAVDEWLAVVEQDTPRRPAGAEDPRGARRRRRRAAVHRRCRQDVPAAQCDAVVRATRRRASRPACRSPTTRSSASSCRWTARATASTFTDAQWERLQAAFPNGVCDYTQPGTDREPTKAWQSYQGGPGGEPLGARPRARGRWPGAAASAAATSSSACAPRAARSRAPRGCTSTASGSGPCGCAAAGWERASTCAARAAARRPRAHRHPDPGRPPRRQHAPLPHLRGAARRRRARS